jgi:hypothetical protein
MGSRLEKINTKGDFMLNINKAVIVLDDGTIFQFNQLIHVVAFYELSKHFPMEVAKEYAIPVCNVWGMTIGVRSVEEVAYLFAEYMLLPSNGREIDLEKIKKYVAKNYNK